MKGFKTIFAGLAVTVLGFLETFNVTDVLGFIPDQYDPLVISGAGFLMVVLRLVTNSPVGQK